jgi:hypothetical protein
VGTVRGETSRCTKSRKKRMSEQEENSRREQQKKKEEKRGRCKRQNAAL